MFGGAGELISGPFFIGLTTPVNAAAGAINLRLGYGQARNFATVTTIAAAAAVSLLGALFGRQINWSFTINAGVPLTLPSTFRMSDNRFVEATKIWTPDEAGRYTLSAWWDGTAWNTTISLSPQNT